MKNSLLLVLLLVNIVLYGQIQEEVIQVSPPTEHFVPAAGLSRSGVISIPVELPPNTIRWYYSFAAFRTQEQIQAAKTKFSLLSSASRFIDVTGTVGKGIELAGSPPGTHHCDANLIRTNRAGERVRILAYERPNLKNGTVVVANPDYCNGLQYLSFANQSTAYGISIVLEVVAIVEKEITVNNWTGPQREELYNELLVNLLQNHRNSTYSLDQLRRVARCASLKMVEDLGEAHFRSLASFERESAIEEVCESCMPAVHNVHQNGQRQRAPTPTNLEGRWKDNNSTFTLYPEGIFSIFWEDSSDAAGRWSVQGDFLELETNGGFLSKYRIHYFDENEWVFQDLDPSDNTIYYAERLNTYEWICTETDLVGSWQADNAKFELRRDSRIIIQFDTGHVVQGKWELNGKLLTCTFTNNYTDYDIIEFSSNRMIYRHRDGNRELFLARRI